MAREPTKASAPATEPLPASLADELAAFIEYLRVER
ncbi:TPA: tyrosine recombinase XerC, partial [Aeromonas salmonicida]|nr:tyrosine recombinase XerC [Aeromonas salmonicida]